MEPVTGKTNKDYLQGPFVDIKEDYGGLGAHFLNSLFENRVKIHQIDTVTGVTETNGSVRSRAIQVAHELHHFGVIENDIILICCRSHSEQTVVVLACLLVGAIVAPIDPEFQHKEYVELVKQLKPKICFCGLRSLKQIERVLAETELSSTMIHFGEQQQYSIAFQKLLLNKRPELFKPTPVQHPRKRVAFILPTQGTSGTPKLVCLSHHFIFSQVSLFLTMMDSPEKIVSFYSLSSVIQVVLMCLCFKIPVVRVLPGPFSERTACKLIHDLKIDHVFLHTDLALELVEHVAVRDFNLSCLKSVFIGSLTTTSHDIKRLVHRLPSVRFTQIYSTTETGVIVTTLLQEYEESLERLGTIGKVVQNVQLRIVDIDTRKDQDVETSGELLAASDCMMLGYFKCLPATKTCTQDGFFKTGDIARFDESGWIFLQGRISDLIKVHGYNELPSELEDIILMHPFVKDTAVIANDKEVVACVIAKADTNLDEDKLLNFINERCPVQRPTRILFMTDFPTTPLGKVRRDVLKEEVLTVRIEHSNIQVVNSETTQ